MKLLPARKIYYGWYILVGVILAQFMATSTGPDGFRRLP